MSDFREVAVAQAVRIRPSRYELVVAAGMLGAQLGLYVLTVACSRILGVDRYGELAANLTITLIAAVPAFALQALVARRCALAISAGTEVDADHELVRLTVQTTILTTVMAGVLTLALSSAVRTDAVTAVPAAMIAVVPLAAISLAQGRLQGSRRLPRLSLLLFAAGFGRLVGGAVALTISHQPWVVLAGIGVGTALVAGFGLCVSGAGRPRLRPIADWRPLGRVTSATGAMWLISSIDVIAARIALSDHDAGLYAAMALIARAMYWAPQFISVSAFAELTDQAKSAALLRDAFAKVLALSAVGVVVAAVVGPTVVPRLFGSEYAEVKNLAPLFVALGAALSLTQLLVAQRIARHDEAVTVVVLLAAFLDVGLVLAWVHDSVAQVAACGLVVAVVLVLALAARVLAKP